MPNFNFPKIVRPLDLGEYAPELQGQSFDVWVNPKRALVGEYVGIQDELMRLKVKLDEIVERSKQDGVGADLTAEVEALDEKIDAANSVVFGWFATIWSQGADEAKYETPETVRAFVVEAADTDPALWSWISTETLTMIREHREGNRKN